MTARLRAHDASRNGSSGRFRFAILAVFALSLWSFWPALHGYYYLDDFAFVTIARYTDHPLAYYLSQHFPGGFFYRPSGMLLWWLTVAADMSPAAQYAINWVLLGCAAVLLAQLLRTLGLSSRFALGAALVFAVHPIAVTTAGWLSNRFDLLVAIGLLVALIGSTKWSSTNGVGALVLTALGTLLAVTAKELGFITALAVLASMRGNPIKRIVALPFVISAALTGAAFLVRRTLLPGTD